MEDVTKRLKFLQVLVFLVFLTERTIAGHFENVLIGEGVRINRGVRIGSHSVLGDHSRLQKNVYIGDNCQIGRKAVINDGVIIYDNVRIPPLTNIECDYFVVEAPTTQGLLDIIGDFVDSIWNCTGTKPKDQDLIDKCRASIDDYVWSCEKDPADPELSSSGLKHFQEAVAMYLVQVYGEQKVLAMMKQPNDPLKHPKLKESHFTDEDDVSKKIGLSKDTILAFRRRLAFSEELKRHSKARTANDEKCKNIQRLKNDSKVLAFKSSSMENRLARKAHETMELVNNNRKFDSTETSTFAGPLDRYQNRDIERIVPLKRESNKNDVIIWITSNENHSQPPSPPSPYPGPSTDEYPYPTTYSPIDPYPPIFENGDPYQNHLQNNCFNCNGTGSDSDSNKTNIVIILITSDGKPIQPTSPPSTTFPTSTVLSHTDADNLSTTPVPFEPADGGTPSNEQYQHHGILTTTSKTIFKDDNWKNAHLDLMKMFRKEKTH